MEKIRKEGIFPNKDSVASRVYGTDIRKFMQWGF
jgi:hypothetical protein